MRDTDFTYAVAYIKTLENKMLSKRDFEIMADSELDSALKTLEQRGYDTKASIDDMIAEQERFAWSEVMSVLPAEADIEALKYENDFHNLKAVIKAVVSNRNWSGLIVTPCVCEPQTIEKAVKTADFSQLPKFMQAAAAAAYEAVSTAHDGQEAEIIIDKAYFESVIKAWENNSFLKGYYILWADMVNISLAVRCARQGRSADFIRNALIPQGGFDISELAHAAAQGEDRAVAEAERKYPEAAEAAEISASELDKVCRNKRMEYIKRVKSDNFGFNPIPAFLIGKNAELQNLRIVLYGLLNNTDKNTILERLGDTYA